MNRKFKLFTVILFLFIPILLIAQSEKKSSDYSPVRGIQQTKGFLDRLLKPENFNMSHSYSISYYSMGGSAFSQGLYLNTLNYKFADPVMMQVRFGYLHHPFGMGGVNSKNSTNGQFFIQRAMFKYQPSKNINFTIDFQQIPQTMIPPYGYYGRFTRRHNHNNFIFGE
ncbi:MAG: hypothetical protein R6V04_15235 [bacterium]